MATSDEPTNGANSNDDLDDYTFDIQDATDVPLEEKFKPKHTQFTKDDIYNEMDLVVRAKMIKRMNAIKWPHPKPYNPRNPDSSGPKTDSALNRYKVFDYLFDHGRGDYPQVVYPHYDIYKGKLVDHEGNLFGIDTPIRKIVEAVNAAGLDNPTEGQVETSLRTWAKDHKIDSLAQYFNKTIPEWDGLPRLETKLIDLFEPRDTPLTRLIGKYFWLSLYNRITKAGSIAPITIALIGAQDAGKSYFSLLLSRTLTGDSEGGVVELDLSARTYTQFLRDITGQSLIANIGEMIGFNKGDMIRIKAFITRTEDEFDFKFADSKVKKRQWITIMDGNGYDGLQRDDTGNRRFYPIFVFQGPDKNGQPTWQTGVKADFTHFAEDVWQIMAECRQWMNEHDYYGYLELVKHTNRELGEFSIEEMKGARGVVKDENVEQFLKEILINCEWYQFRKSGPHNGGFKVRSADISKAYLDMRISVNTKTLATLMKAIGFESNDSGFRGYRIYNSNIDPKGKLEEVSLNDLQCYIYSHGFDDEDAPTIEEARQAVKTITGQSKGGGF